MPSDPPGVAVRFTPHFKRSLATLAKRYRHIQSDLQPLLDSLAQGQFIGDQIPGLGQKQDGKPYRIYKVRAANRDAKRGKSGGYRLIYDATEPGQVILLLVYSKSDRGDIPATEIHELLRDFEQTQQAGIAEV